ncbi:MAG: hypothetical protein IPM95_06775 [Sphingobacteriales bacterium]|nr:hypothetical protein [Sphingobacteriales bacterium]
MTILGNTYGQVDISFRNLEQSGSVKDLWNLNISSFRDGILYVHTTLNSIKNGKIYEARSNTLQLLGGTHLLRADMLSPIQELFVLPGWDYQLDNDQYRITVRALSFPSNQVLSEYTATFIVNPKNNTRDSSGKQKKNVHFSVNGALNGQYSDAFKNDYVFQPNYVRFDIHPTLTLFEIPVSADVFVTSEQKNNPNTINNFVFRFDYNQFKNKLIQKLLKESDKVIQQKIPGKYEFLKKMDLKQAPYFYKNAGEWTEKLKSGDVQEKLQSVKKLDQVKEIIRNPEIKKKLESIESFKDKYNLSSVAELKGQIEHLDGLSYDKVLNWTKDLQLDSLPMLKEILSCIHNSDGPLNGNDSASNALSRFGLDSGSINKLRTDAALGVFNGLDSLLGYKESNAYKLAGKFMEFTDVKSVKDIKQLVDLKQQYDNLMRHSLTALENKKEIRQLMNWQHKLRDYDKIDINNLLNNESDLNALLNQFTILSRKEQFFKGLKVFELGTVFPHQSSLGINGVMIKGYNIEYGTGKIFLSSFAGKGDNILVDSLNPSNTRYKKVVASFGAGYGSENENHFHVHYLYSKENGGSYFDSTLNILRVPSVSHTVVSDAGVLMCRKKLFIGNEFGYTFNNSRYSNNGEVIKHSIHDLAQKTFMIGYIPVSKTKIKSSVQYVGKNYLTHNTPFLLKDRLILEANIEQSLANNKIQIFAQYRFDLDSLSKPAIYRSQIHSCNISAGLSIPRLPYVQVTYTPVLMIKGIQRLNTQRLNYTGSVVVNTGYSFSAKDNKLSGNIQFVYSNTRLNTSDIFRTEQTGIGVNYLSYVSQTIHTVSLNQIFTFKNNTSIQYALQYVQPSYTDSLVYKTISAELNCSWVMLKKSQNTVGVTIVNGNKMNRIGFYIQTTFPVTKYVNIDLRLQKEQLNRTTDGLLQKIHGITFRSQLRFRI